MNTYQFKLWIRRHPHPQAAQGCHHVPHHAARQVLLNTK